MSYMSYMVQKNMLYAFHQKNKKVHPAKQVCTFLLTNSILCPPCGNYF